MIGERLQSLCRQSRRKVRFGVLLALAPLLNFSPTANCSLPLARIFITIMASLPHHPIVHNSRLQFSPILHSQGSHRCTLVFNLRPLVLALLSVTMTQSGRLAGRQTCEIGLISYWKNQCRRARQLLPHHPACRRVPVLVDIDKSALFAYTKWNSKQRGEQGGIASSAAWRSLFDYVKCKLSIQSDQSSVFHPFTVMKQNVMLNSMKVFQARVIVTCAPCVHFVICGDS